MDFMKLVWNVIVSETEIQQQILYLSDVSESDRQTLIVTFSINSYDELLLYSEKF